MNKRQYKKNLNKMFWFYGKKNKRLRKDFIDKQIEDLVDQILEINFFPKWLRVDEPWDKSFFTVEAVENE